MQRVTFTNSRGESIELYETPFFLNKIEGLGDVEGDIKNQKAPGQDGSTYIDTNLSERSIPMEVIILKDMPANRQFISRIFNPKLGQGLLTFENDIVKRQILATSEHVPIFADIRPRLVERVTIDLICHDPFWQDIEPSNYKLEDFVSNFRFPFHFPVRFASRGDSKVLVNHGDAPTPIKVTFNGNTVNPKITNITTGEFIKVNYTIPEGHSLVLNTEFGNKEVKIVAPDGVETNAFSYIDLESTFFHLGLGENRISFITDGGKPEVYVEYKNRYIAV
jgi:hypothetical protein